jgi:hypothetical protein
MVCNGEIGAKRQKPRSQGGLVVVIVAKHELEAQMEVDRERVKE